MEGTGIRRWTQSSMTRPAGRRLEDRQCRYGVHHNGARKRTARGDDAAPYPDNNLINAVEMARRVFRRAISTSLSM
jgi:hypothetical protein